MRSKVKKTKKEGTACGLFGEEARNAMNIDLRSVEFQNNFVTFKAHSVSIDKAEV